MKIIQELLTLHEAKKGTTAVAAFEKLLTSSFEMKIKLTDAMKKDLEGFVADGAAEDIGESIYTSDSIGSSKLKKAYFDAEKDNEGHMTQQKELRNVTKLSGGENADGIYLYLFRNKSMPVFYVVATDGYSGHFNVYRLKVKEAAAPVSEAKAPKTVDWATELFTDAGYKAELTRANKMAGMSDTGDGHWVTKAKADKILSNLEAAGHKVRRKKDGAQVVSKTNKKCGMHLSYDDPDEKGQVGIWLYAPEEEYMHPDQVEYEKKFWADQAKKQRK